MVCGPVFPGTPVAPISRPTGESTSPEGGSMADVLSHDSHPDSWGHCEGCKWWESGPAGSADHAMGLCQQPELVHFQLQVSAGSGCNRFTADVHQPAATTSGAAG
jgi:hypothetical protein